MTRQKVLITGVNGLIGSTLYLRLTAEPDRYEVYGFDRDPGLSPRAPRDRVMHVPDGRFHRAAIENADAVAKAVAGMDAVVHLAATWDRFADILPHNLVGAYNVFAASAAAGVKRIVAASTIQVATGQRQQEPYRSIAARAYDAVPADYPDITAAVAAEPRNLYAASKVWGESLARVYAHTSPLSCLCVRIGWVVAEDRPPNPQAVDIWCSQRDIAQLFARCLDAPADLRFGIFYGVSNNKWNWVDWRDARDKVGYTPQDRAEDFAEEAT